MSDDAVSFWTLPEAVISALPELRTEIRSSIARYIDVLGKQPQPNVVLEEHLLPFVVQADRDGNLDALRRAFVLLERLASHPDEDLAGALGHAFLAHVDPALLDTHATLVGPSLRSRAAAWRRDTVAE